MKTFEYVAADPRGRLIFGSSVAVDEAALDRDLEGRGMTLTRAKVVKPGGQVRRARLRQDELLHLTTQLATMTAAGVPLLDGLKGLAKRMASERARQLVNQLVLGIRAGDSLSSVMKPYSRAFPRVYLASVRAGEASGALDTVLRRLAKHLRWARNLRATTAQALIYPSILFFAILGLLFVLLYYVLPKVIGLFPDGTSSLPSQTRTVMALSEFVQANVVWLALGFGGAVFALWQGLRNAASRIVLHGLLLRLPKVGRLAREIATSRIAATASTLQAAGCDVFTILEISAATCGNAAMEAAFERATQRVRKGETISHALEQEPMVDPLLVQMIHVGEQSGELDNCLERLVEYYDEEVPMAVKRFVTVFESVMLLLAGGLVGYILLSTLLPIFELYQRIG